MQLDTLEPGWILELRRALPTRNGLRLALAPALVFIVAAMDRQFQTDFWMHLARGCEIVATGHWLTAEHFTLAAGGAAICDANWLTQVIYARLFSAGGLTLIQSVNAAMLALANWLLIRLCRRAGAAPLAAGIGGAMAFLLSWQTFLIRPQTFSVLLFVLLYGVLSGARGRSLLICPPLIMMLWANLHGGFAVGLALIGAFTLAEASASALHPAAGSGERFRLLLGTTPLSLLATLLNPYGWRIYPYAASLAARVAPRHLEEWMPPPLNQWIGVAFAGSILLLLVLYIAARRRPTAHELLLLVCFAVPAFHAVRMVVWWAIVTAPIVASLLQAILSRQDSGSERPSLPAGLVLMTLLAVCFLSLPCFEKLNPLFGSVRSPHRTESDIDRIAAAALVGEERGPAGGGIFSRLEWAQYLTWRLGPVRRMFIDSHVELFDDATWGEYCDVTSGLSDWERILAAHGIDYLLLDVTYQPALVREVRSSPLWEETVRAGNAILFTRRGGGVALHSPLAEIDRINMTGRYTPSGLVRRSASIDLSVRALQWGCANRAVGASGSMRDRNARLGPAGGNRQFYGR